MYQSNQSGNGMINVPVILGPTAVGKTETTVKVAEFYDASVISCDSRQVYKYMDIGTAKPDPGLRERVPHYLIDVVTPDTEYSAYDFAGDAERIIRQRYREGKRTLICGGSGFYFSMLSKGGGPPFENSAQIKAEYKRRLKTQGEEALYQRLCKVDPEYAFAISPADHHRLIRALSVYDLSGIPYSAYNSGWDRQDIVFHPVILTREREELYKRINSRTQRMFEQGLISECKELSGYGYTGSDPGMKTVGYREFFESEGAESKDLIPLIAQNTRRFAKRQMTWYRNKQEGAVYNLSERDFTEEVIGFLRDKL